MDRMVLQAASYETCKDPTILKVKIGKLLAFKAEIAAHWIAIAALDDTGLEDLSPFVEQLYSKLTETVYKLERALCLIRLDELKSWITDKDSFLTAEEFVYDLEHVEVLQRKFDEFQKDMASQEHSVTEVNELASKLHHNRPSERLTIAIRKNDLNHDWKLLKRKTLEHQKKLQGAHEIHRFNRDVDEIVAWIAEKDVVLSSDDYGHDLASVQALQRKHEGVERDLAALEEKVSTLDKEADCLGTIHSGYGDQIQTKRAELEDYWQRLTAKAWERREKLEESYTLHRFLLNFRDLVVSLQEHLAFMISNETENVQRSEEIEKAFQAIMAGDVPYISYDELYASKMDQIPPFQGIEILEKLQESDETYNDPTILRAKAREVLAFEEEVGAHWDALVALDTTGVEELLRPFFEQLFSKLTETVYKLQRALCLIRFDELMFWITDKSSFLTAEEFIYDLEHVEALQRKFDEFQKDMAAQEYRVTEVNELTDKLLHNRHSERLKIANRKNDLNHDWKLLKRMTLEHQKKLQGAHEIHRFNRDVDEIVALIAEKDMVLSSVDYGRDVESVQALQQKHEGVERDLAVLEDKVSTLREEADRLLAIHSGHADEIQSNREEMEAYWQHLTAKAKERRKKLEESYALHRFRSDFRDLVSWINDMKAIISADELAKDVAGAESLLEQHQEYRSEIDAREDSFAATIEAGRQLLEKKHYASDEVKEKLSTLESKKNSLLALWEECKIMYGHCMDLQIFYRAAEDLIFG